MFQVIDLTIFIPPIVIFRGDSLSSSHNFTHSLTHSLSQYDSSNLNNLYHTDTLSYQLLIPPLQISFHTISCHTIPPHTMPYHPILFNTIQYNSIQSNPVQFPPIQLNSLQNNLIKTNTCPKHMPMPSTHNHNKPYIIYHTMQYHPWYFRAMEDNSRRLIVIIGYCW